jgi:hypothetical protein
LDESSELPRRQRLGNPILTKKYRFPRRKKDKCQRFSILYLFITQLTLEKMTSAATTYVEPFADASYRIVGVIEEKIMDSILSQVMAAN